MRLHLHIQTNLYHHEAGAAAHADPRRTDPITHTLQTVTRTEHKSYNNGQAEVGGPQEYLSPEAFSAYKRSNAMK